MPKIDIDAIAWDASASYPEPFRSRATGKARKRLGDAGGLTQFGVNLKRLEPGADTALRHWHETEDEFVFVLEGEATLIDDQGEHTLGPGEAAAFRAGDPNGHHVVNRSDAPVLLLEIGSRHADERGHYPDDDLAIVRSGGVNRWTRMDGSLIE